MSKETDYINDVINNLATGDYQFFVHISHKNIGEVCSAAHNAGEFLQRGDELTTFIAFCFFHFKSMTIEDKIALEQVMLEITNRINKNANKIQ